MQGDPFTPELIRLTGETGYVFALGNRIDFELPLTGGFGTRMFVVAGTALAGAGLLTMWMLAAGKKIRKKSVGFQGGMK